MTTKASTDMSLPELSGNEVHRVFLEILQGKRPIIRVTLQTWDEVYAGLVVFDAGGWILTFFNDCDELDYCHSCVAPDGRSGSYDTWYDAGTEPVMLLDDHECLQLEEILKSL